MGKGETVGDKVMVILQGHTHPSGPYTGKWERGTGETVGERVMVILQGHTQPSSPYTGKWELGTVGSWLAIQPKSGQEAQAYRDIIGY